MMGYKTAQGVRQWWQRNTVKKVIVNKRQGIMCKMKNKESAQNRKKMHEDIWIVLKNETNAAIQNSKQKEIKVI